MSDRIRIHGLRSKPILGLFFLGAGVGLILLRLIMLPMEYAFSGPGAMSLIAAILIMLNGILRLTLPAATVGGGMVRLNNALGMAVRTVKYGNGENLRFREGYLEVCRNGTWERLRWMRAGRFREQDWQDLRRLIEKKSGQSVPKGVSTLDETYW